MQTLGKVQGMATVLGRLLKDSLLAPTCVCCGTHLWSGDGLCPSCFSAITMLGTGGCACCGLPLSDDERRGEEPHLCAVCQRTPPPFLAARAAMVYNQASRPVLLRFKHADQSHMAPTLARWLYRVGAPLMSADAVTVPVPLHRLRLFRRRYNQAALLARGLARLAGVKSSPDALVRVRNTISQGSFDHRATDQHSRRAVGGNRWQNVHGAFAVHRPAALHGRQVVLVDDVMTSGATVNECTRVIMEAGAASVIVLVVARALPPGMTL